MLIWCCAVVVIGGTRFVGQRVTERLAARGDEVMLVHRGAAEPPPHPRVWHLHVDRRDFATVAGRVRRFGRTLWWTPSP